MVDDEPINVRILASALADGYEIHFATDGRRALEIAAAVAPDLLLLDVVMPGLDGFEVLRRLKADEATAGIPVIFVTAASEVDDEARGFEQGAVDYITKPISPPIVRARVRTHIELKDQRDLLARRASIDGLTGIANRRRFDEHLGTRWREGLRSGEPLSLVLLDVDFFKQFNDGYGHAAGDDCLRRIAAVLDAACDGEGELAVRYGGEEFAVILPATPAAVLATRAAALRAAVEALAIPHASSTAAPHVTVSAGGVTTVPAPGSSPATLLESADRLLYQAKREGRNRVVTRDVDAG